MLQEKTDRITSLQDLVLIVKIKMEKMKKVLQLQPVRL